MITEDNVLPPPPPLVAFLATPQGARGASALLGLYAAACRRSPWLAGLATGIVVTAALINARRARREP